MTRGDSGFSLVRPRVGVFSLFRPGVLSGRQGFTLTHTHTHIESNHDRQDCTTHTQRHTPHTVTHAHTRTQSHAHTHAHTHTQGQAHAHKQIQTHANTRTQNTHTLTTLPVDKTSHVRQLQGTGEERNRPSNHTRWWCSVIRSVQARPHAGYRE